MESLEKQFFFSQYQSLDVIAESEKSKVERVFYTPRQTVCVVKTYYNRNLEELYRRLKDIHHKNLAAVYDAIFCDGNTYVVEELIDGETLAEYIQMEGIFTEKEVLSIIKEVCDGLEKLHSQNPPLIHRDIKPGNVMLRSDGSVKLIDFDTVRSYKDTKNQDTVLLGTKEYASPEHYGYGQTGITSDIYSVGVMMHEMLTGKILENHKTVYKGRLLPVINRCIQVDSKRRFHSVEELEKMLATYEKPWGVLSRNKRKLGVLCGIVCVFAIGAAVWNAKQEKWPGLEQAYENQESPQLLLENKKVNKMLKELLGTQYSYVKECLYSISDDVSYLDGRYFMKGGMPGMYTIMEAAVSLSETGELECAFLKDGICHYYTNTADLYDTPSKQMREWIFSYEDYTIQFHKDDLNRADTDDDVTDTDSEITEPEKNATSDVIVPGTYTREDSSAYLTFERSEDGTYSVKGGASWSVNTGEIDGPLTQINSQQYLYTEDDADGEIYAELKLVVIDGKIYAETLKGEFGGLNVRFDGTYERQ